jgi:hypothetical protein
MSGRTGRVCGITGWVDFERDLTGHRAVVEAMTATMSCFPLERQ